MSSGVGFDPNAHASVTGGEPITLEDIADNSDQLFTADINEERPLYIVKLSTECWESISGDGDHPVFDISDNITNCFSNYTPLHVGLYPEKNGVIVGDMEDDAYGTVVTDQDILSTVAETDECPCHYDRDPIDIGFRTSIYICYCGRRYFAKPYRHVQDFAQSNPLNPRNVCKTDKEGLVPVSDQHSAFWLINNQDRRTAEYIEGEYSSTAYLWAAGGLFIGALHYSGTTLRTTVIAQGFRGEGHGTEFINTWWEAVDIPQSQLNIMSFNETEGFVEQLNCS